jgi:Na+(H+)/acetate symporter ActP
MPAWFDSWENTGLLVFEDLNGDGLIDYTPDEATNELSIDRDIMVLATPEVAGCPRRWSGWSPPAAWPRRCPPPRACCS